MFANRTNWRLDANRLSTALADHRRSGKPLLDLTVSNPTECGFHYDEEAILRALCNVDSLQYEPDPKGLLMARQVIARYYAARDANTGENVQAASIFLTTGTSEAYSFLFRTLCNPGDELLIPEPSYPLFDFLAEIQDVKLVRYPLLYDHGWQIDVHSLELAITSRTRGVIIVHPNNPTGHFTKTREQTALTELCSTRDLAIIADEVFLDFALLEGVPASFAGNTGALTFTLSGLSKIAGLPQMKVGWLVVSGPKALRESAIERIEVVADTYLSMNTPIQLAIPHLLEQRHGFQRQLMARVRQNLAEVDRQLSAQQSCNRLHIEGGWYAILRVPATSSDEDLAIQLLTEECVYVHPGHFYDFPSAGYLVVSLITPEEQFMEGIKRLLSKYDVASHPVTSLP